MAMSIPKSQRLTSNQQFKSVLDRGRRAGDSLLTLYAAPNQCGRARLGVSVGKSSGKAVVRNRLKRLLREAFRRSQDRLQPGFDYVLMISSVLSRKLKQQSDGAKTLHSLRMERMQESLLALVSIAAKPSASASHRISRQDRTDHE
jgi:ribonuclease P protein component